jgi:hypothetical protein
VPVGKAAGVSRGGVTGTPRTPPAGAWTRRSPASHSDRTSKDRGPGRWDRDTVLVSLAVSIVLGATSMSGINVLAHQAGVFGWLCVAGKLLSGWVVIDLDAALIGANSPRQGTAATFKRGFGFHPLGGWCANTVECLFMLPRPGNAGSNTVSDHIRVLGEAVAQLSSGYQEKILIRVDGAGATHELLEHLTQTNTVWRRVRFTIGWTITDAERSGDPGG